MATILVPASPGAIADYEALKTTVSAWLHRTDLEPQIPSFIALVEEKANDRLRVHQMVVTMAATPILATAVAVPANTVGVKALWPVGHPECPLDSAPYESIGRSYMAGVQPRRYAWTAGNFYFDGDGSVQGALYARIPALSSTNPTNWLLLQAPSVYLFGALVEAHLFADNAQEAAMWASRFDQRLSDVDSASARDTLSGRLRVRVR